MHKLTDWIVDGIKIAGVFLETNHDMISLVLEILTFGIAIVAAFQVIKNLRAENCVAKCSEAAEEMYDAIVAIFDFLVHEVESQNAVLVSDKTAEAIAVDKRDNASRIFSKKLDSITKITLPFASDETMRLLLDLRGFISSNQYKTEPYALIAIPFLFYSKLRLEVNNAYIPFRRMYRTFGIFPGSEDDILGVYIKYIRKLRLRGWCFIGDKLDWYVTKTKNRLRKMIKKILQKSE